MKIAVLGSGSVGEVLANGFIAHGHDVMRGSRSADKLAAWKAGAGARAHTGSFAEAARWGEIAVLAVKGTAAVQVVTSTEGGLDGKTVLDTTNPIADAPPQDGVLRFFSTHDQSLMEQLQQKAPEARFVKAFNSVGAAVMIDPKLPGGPPTMFICGNDAAAKAQTRSLLNELGWQVADMGTAVAARAIEPLCMLWCIPGFTQNKWGHAFRLLEPQ